MRRIPAFTESSRLSLRAFGEDLRFSFRSLRRSPCLSIAIIATLGIGVGVNAALFTVVDPVFFRAPDGVVDPQRVRRLFVDQLGVGGRRYTSDRFSVADQRSLQEAAGDSLRIEGYAVRSDARVDDVEAPRSVGYVTSGFFELAGVRAYRGRLFLPEENTYGDPTRIAVLSHNFWRAAYGGDSTLLGRAIRIDTVSFFVVGIAPSGFGGMDRDAVDVWTPLATLPVGGEGPWWNHRFAIIKLFTRLPASDNEPILTSRLTARYRAANDVDFVRDPALRLEIAPLLQARSSLRSTREEARNIALLTRLAGVGLFVVLIAMTNVASLLLMRAVRRRREMALRLALGVSEGRLFLQLLCESLLLAAIGAGVAFVIAWSLGSTLRQLLFPGTHWSLSLIDARVLIATGFVAIVVACAAGLVPLAVARQPNLMDALKSGRSEGGRTQTRLRGVLLASQTALCMVMVMLAGIFTQSLRRASAVDVGYDADRLVTLAISRVNPAVADEALARIGSLPSIAAIARSNVDLIGGLNAGISFPNGDSIPAIIGPTYALIDSAYAPVLGLRLVRGRFLNKDDRSRPSVMINEAMAQAYWPGKHAVGECFFAATVKDGCLKIVGIVGDVRWDLTDLPLKWMYLPGAPIRCCSFVTIRTRGTATPDVITRIRQATAQLTTLDQKHLPEPRLVQARREPIMRPWRLSGMMFVVFAILAIAAAAAGIYGLVAYEATQRQHEFGVRAALGASPRHLRTLILTSGVKTVLAGIAVGLFASVAAGRLTASLLFETAPDDPVVLSTSALTLIVMACLASAVPAWRAGAVDPVITLKDQT